MLVICQTVLLWNSCAPGAQLRLGALSNSSYVQWNSHHHNVNLSAPLLDHTFLAQQAVIQFFWSEELILQELQRNISQRGSRTIL
jgi:hypothetical protein